MTKKPAPQLSAGEIRRREQYPLMAFLSELSRVKDDPRLLVLVAHGIVELFVSTIVEVRCRNGKKIADDSRSYPHAVRLVILNEIGVLSDPQFRMYDWFRKLRNKAAHDPIFVLSVGQLTMFKARYRDPAAFHEVAQTLVTGLWNANLEALREKFVPGLVTYFRAMPPRDPAQPRPPLPEDVLLPAK